MRSARTLRYGQRMKVALELQPCCGKRSGIGMYAYELAKRLENEEDLEFSGNLFNFLGRNDNKAALQGIRIPLKECKVFPYGVYCRMWNLVPIPYRALFADKVDLSIFFNYIVPPQVHGKVITTVYDMTYMRFPETMSARNRRRLDGGLRYSVEHSDHILTISEFSKREIVELLGVDEGRISVVPCAPAISAKAADMGSCKKKFGITGPYLFFVGTIEPRKNLLRLLNAFALLKREQGIPHQLVLAGGKGWENEEIYRAAEEISDVIFTGYLTESEKTALYGGAEAFVFPSVYEGFGIPPLEAMLMGCPVVCADAASLPEVVGDAAELVDPLDVTAIAEGIWHVISDRKYAQDLVGRGREQVKNYTWAASAQKLTQICREMLKAT